MEEEKSRDSHRARLPYKSDFRETPCPTMRLYDGKSDPMVHLLKYEQYKEVVGAIEEIMSKFFPIYLNRFGDNVVL